MLSPLRVARLLVALVTLVALTPWWSAAQGAPADSAPPLPSLTPLFPGDRFLPADARLALRLSRPIAREEGRVALFVGSTDVTGLLVVSDTAVEYRPSVVPVRAGRTEVIAYLVTPAGEWREIGRFPVQLLTRRGFQEAATDPNTDLSSSGPVSQGQRGVPGEPGKARQDLFVNSGFRSSLARGAWALTTQANLVGAGGERRLRFAQQGRDAPELDLADYLVRAQRGAFALSAGHMQLSAGRHLLANFATRGVAGALPFGRVAKLDLAASGGANMVGWDDPVGLTRPDGRMLAASLGVELRPARPGLAHLDLGVLDGRLRPVSGYAQGAVTDAERSRGMSVQLAGQDPGQRLRVSAGVTRSRFVNPADRLLSRDSGIVASRAVTRQARFADVGVRLLRDRPLLLTRGPKLSLEAGVRHERVDPLFRSVGAVTRADYEQNAGDLTVTLGALNAQLSASRGDDNLGRVATVLRTRSRDRTATVALPLAAALHATDSAWWWPTLQAAIQTSRQSAAGLPAGGAFAADELPDLASSNRTASATWQRARWSLGYRWNGTLQDTRTPARRAADVASAVHAVSVGYTPRPALTLGAELGAERQENKEFRAVARTRRASLQADWRPFASSSLAGYVSAVRATDRSQPQPQRRTDTELRVEATQGFNLYIRPQGSTQARAFVRYTRSGSALVAPALQDVPDRALWAVNAGLSFHLF